MDTEKWAELRADIRVAEVEARVTQNMVLAMAATLAEGAFDTQRFLDIFEATRGMALANDDQNLANAVASKANVLRAVLAAEGVTPETVIMTYLRIHERTRPDQRAAMQTWLASASPEEIAQEFRHEDGVLPGEDWGHRASGGEGPSG